MSVKNDCGNEVHKFLWFDTETTGTDPIKHDIIQIAGQIVVGGIVMDSFDYRCQPFDWDTIEEKALEKNGITREEIATFPEPDIIYGKLKRMFRKYIRITSYNVCYTKLLRVNSYSSRRCGVR